MVTNDELGSWLAGLPDDAHVGVNEGGLVLLVLEDPENYLEIGGMPEGFKEPV